jgi:hypothetical protein
MLLFAWVGAFCGLIFWGLGSGLDGVRNRVNLLFIVVQLFMLLVGPQALCAWLHFFPWRQNATAARLGYRKGD